MAKEWFDIVDSALKIGLGALISGFFTYVGIKFSKQFENKKIIIEHKIKLLEQVADHAEGIFSVWDEVISRMGGIAKKHPPDENAISLNDSQRNLIKEGRDKYIEARAKKESCLSKLRLINANRAANKFMVCDDLFSKFRDDILFDHQYYNFNQIIEYKHQLNKCQEDFHKELSAYYEKFSN